MSSIPRKLILANYGFHQPTPAVTATLCLSETHAAKLHDMLCSITCHESKSSMLVFNMHKWQFKEPWTKILEDNPTLPKIVRGHREQRDNSINIRGQGGDSKARAT